MIVVGLSRRETHFKVLRHFRQWRGGSTAMVRQRVRIRFCKQGDLRYVGHRDLVRTMERVFRRAGLKLGMSQGFHPKPRMSFPSALAVGIEGMDEVMDLELAAEYAPGEIFRRLGRCTVTGLVFRSVRLVPPGTKNPRLLRASYRMALPDEQGQPAAARASQIMARQSVVVDRPNKPSGLDIRPGLEQLDVSQGELRMQLATGRESSPSARDVLRALGLEDVLRQGFFLTRTRVELQS